MDKVDSCAHKLLKSFHHGGVGEGAGRRTGRPDSLLALTAVIVLAAARLLCVLSGQIFEDEGGAPFTELISVGVQAAGTGQLQELFPQLGRVSLRGGGQQKQLTYSSRATPVRGCRGYLQRSGVMGHGAADSLVAAVLLNVADPFLTLTHDLCPLQVEVFVDHLHQNSHHLTLSGLTSFCCTPVDHLPRPSATSG